MESMEDRVATLEAQLLAHRMLFSIIAADVPPSLRRQLAAAAEAATNEGLFSLLPDDTLQTIRQELQQCVPPDAPKSSPDAAR